MTENQYLKSLLKARAITDFNMTQAEKKIIRSLNKAYRDIVRLLNLSKEGSLTQTNYLTKKKAIERLLRDMMLSIKNNIHFCIKDNLNTNVQNDLKSTTAFAGEVAGIESIFAGIPQKAFANVINRSSKGVRLSGRLWRMNNLARMGVHDIVTAGIARGQSTVSMAKELKRFLVDPTISPGESWTTGVRKSVTGRGTLHFNTIRVAKTEINNSYREGNVLSAVRNPIIKGVKWNLSTAHEIVDICDVWATQNAYGMGPGVFHPAAVPVDHPYGDCYLTSVLRKASDWKKPKTILKKTRRVSKASVEKVLGPLGMSDTRIKSTYKQYVDNDILVNKNVKAIQK